MNMVIIQTRVHIKVLLDQQQPACQTPLLLPEELTLPLAS